MQAVEFEAVVQGGMIKLPKSIRNLPSEHLRIIAVFPDNPVKLKRNKYKFNAVKLETKNFKFDRDALYER